jgi:amidophosphoribosyltransferase
MTARSNSNMHRKNSPQKRVKEMLEMNPFTSPFDDDKFHEECGVFGIFDHEDAAALVTLGLHALQHRGQEAAGIVSFDGTHFHSEKHVGLIGDNFTKPKVLKRLPGRFGVGHTRYSTSGGEGVRNIQPFFAEYAGGGFSVAHNGNLTNAMTIRQELQRRGAIFSSTSDTEVIMHLVAMSSQNALLDRLVEAVSQLEGAFSLVGLSGKKMIGCRDPLGVRPLVLGDLDGAYILASETCALDIIGARYVRDIEPGELVVINENGVDSYISGKSVYEVRKQIGVELAKESELNADVVVPIPDSGTPAAIGYAQESKLPFELGIIRNHYVGRTFIQPSDAIRHMGVKLKHNANRQFLENKKVVLVDDSIVRGTTSQKIVQMVRDAGALEVHMRIASPPTISPCFYGVDTPSKQKLLASRMNVDEIAKFINADSLAFISLEGLYRAAGETSRDAETPQFCDACFSENYPTALTDKNNDEIKSGAPLLTISSKQ